MNNNNLVLFSVILVVASIMLSCGKETKAVNIEVYTLSLEVQDDIMKGVFDEFRKDNPNVNLDVVVDGHESWKTKIKVLQTSGDLPEIFTTQPSDMVIYKNDGIYKNLTPWIEEDPDWSENFFPGAFDAVTFDNKIYAIPEQTYTEGIFYNTKILNELNLSIPTTYKELLATVKVLATAGYIPMAIGGKDAWPVLMTTQYLMDREVGYEHFENGNTDVNVSAEIDGYKEAYNKFITLRDANAFGKTTLSQSYADATTLFLQEKAAMIINGSWFIPQLLEQEEDFLSHISYKNFPQIEKGKGIQSAAVVGYGKSFAISSKITAKQEPYVKDLLKRLTSAKIANTYIAKALPKPFKPDFIDSEKVPELLQDSLSMVSDAQQTWPAYGELITPGYMDVLSKIGQQLLSGDLNAEQATKVMEEGRLKYQIKNEQE